LSKRKRHARTSSPPPLQFHLTLSGARLLKDALSAFTEVLLRTKEPHPPHPITTEVLDRAKTKLDDMLQREEWGKETPFDYNEVHIFYAAVHVYLVDLIVSDQKMLLPKCVLLCKQFSQMIKAVKGMELQQTTPV
jgi:hypothetical protein